MKEKTVHTKSRKEVQEANARMRLMLAAPQLLEALEAIAEDSELTPQQELIGCKAVARAAITAAKETG